MDKFTVRGVDGSVDVSASAEAYYQSLTEWVSKNEVSNEAVESALDNIFEKTPGRITTQFLAALAARDLCKSADSFPSLRKRVHAYLKHAVTTGEKYTLLRGAGGGVTKVSRSDT